MFPCFCFFLSLCLKFSSLTLVVLHLVVFMDILLHFLYLGCHLWWFGAFFLEVCWLDMVRCRRRWAILLMGLLSVARWNMVAKHLCERSNMAPFGGISMAPFWFAFTAWVVLREWQCIILSRKLFFNSPKIDHVSQRRLTNQQGQCLASLATCYQIDLACLCFLVFEDLWNLVSLHFVKFSSSSIVKFGEPRAYEKIPKRRLCRQKDKAKRYRVWVFILPRRCLLVGYV